MKIVHLSNTINDAGNGITNVLVDLALEQSMQGHETTVISRGGTFEPLLVEHGVRLRYLDFTSRAPYSLFRSRAKLAAALSEVAPDIVHCHTLTPVALASTLRWRPPLVATVHNEWQRGVRLMARADAVVGVSSAVSKAMQQRGVNPGRLHTVLNGVTGTLRRPTTPSRSGAQFPPRAIVSVGSVSPRKGSDILIDAFSLLAPRHPELALYFVGKVDWPQAVERSTRSGFGERIKFVGLAPDPRVYLSEDAIFALPSRKEPLGLAFLEAHESGVPCVGTDIDGIPEALANGRAGLLVPPEDATSLAEAIEQLLESPRLRESLKAEGVRLSRERTTHAMAARYIELYRTLR